MAALLAWAIRYTGAAGWSPAPVLVAADLLDPRRPHQGDYGNVFLLLHRRPDRRLHVRVAAADGGGARPAQREAAAPRPSGPGWPGSCTTACCRCWPWCSGAAPSSAVRRRARPARRGAGGRAAHPDPHRRTAWRRHRRRHRSTWPRALGRLAPRPGRPGRDPGRARCDLPAARSRELVAVVSACLDNVVRARRRRRARLGAARGRSATGWSSRCATRVPASPTAGSSRPRREGRLGVSESIRGPDRATSAAPPTLSTGAFGTEWELVVPRTASHDDPLRPPVRRPRARPGPPAPRPARRRRDALDRRRGRGARRADGHAR